MMVSRKVCVQTLRYEETVQLGCRHLGCNELDPPVGVALYLRTNGELSWKINGVVGRLGY